MLGGFAALVCWNVFHYDWLRGYDAFANARYAEIVSTEWRLPSEAESGSWHSPPLWFALAGALGRVASAGGLEPPQRAGQLLAAAAAVTVCVLVVLLARELWPTRPDVQLTSLALTASSPVLVRAATMYHPETLAAALATGGVLLTVRALVRGLTPGRCGAAGAVLGLAAVTRGWALPVLVVALAALLLEAGRRRCWLPALALACTAAVLVAPWLAHQAIVHGDPLAFNREPPAESLLDRRPASFYLGPRFLQVFEHPVTPTHRNELVPQLYADWWGDWALTWDAPEPPAPGVLLPGRVVSERSRQSLLGLVPAITMLAGLLALAFTAISTRSPALAVVPAAALAVAAAFVLFTVRYPSTDGDTIKAVYALLLLPGAALGAGFLIDELRPRSGLATAALVVAAGLLVAAQLPFLVL